MNTTPQIEKQTHYNIIVMTDDGSAKTYRLRKSLVRFFIFLPFLLVLLSGGVIVGGMYFGKQYLNLQAEQEKQDMAMSELRLRLERLTNIEELLSAGPGLHPTQKTETMAAAPTMPPIQSAQPPQPSPTQANTRQSSQPEPVTSRPAAEPVTPPAREVAEAPDEDYQTSLPVQDIDRPTRKIPPLASPSKLAQTGGNSTRLNFSSMPLLSSNKSPLRVGDFHARTLGQQRVRIRYELAASKPSSRIVSGQVRHFAVFTNGGRAELPLPDNGETRFSITRLKPMEATTRLPQGYDTKDIKQIDVVIITDELGTFHDLFEVANWRSY